MTKKTSTPTNPPLKTGTFGNAWKTKTANTANARRPSMSGRQPMEDFCFLSISPDLLFIGILIAEKITNSIETTLTIIRIS